MKKLVIILIGVMPNVMFGQAISEEKKPLVVIEGQVALTTNVKGVFLNFGGPGVRFTFSNLALSINLMPTLRFQEEEPKSFVTPLLGFGPQLFFLKDKRLILSFPFYYNTTKNNWTISGGLGYFLTKSKRDKI